MKITRAEVLQGRDVKYPLSPEQESNLTKLLEAVNKFRDIYGKPMTVTSGYRPAAINAAVPNSAKKSNHIQCLAVDFADTDGSLDIFCAQHIEVLALCGLWLESPANTQGWTHLQCVPPASGRRIFLP